MVSNTIVLFLLLLKASSSTFAPEDIPKSCDALIASTGKSTVTYLANVAASVEDSCKATCVSSICDASSVTTPPARFMETSANLVASVKKTGLRAQKTSVSELPEAGPGCLNKCSGHGSCLQDCRNKEGKECLQNCKNFDSELTCVCSKRCVCNADWGGEDCSQPLQCDGCDLKHGKCTNGNCLCDAGYEGTDCSKRIACPKGPGGFECGGDSRGVCDFGECTCKAGWEGDACETKTPCPDACSENGFCVRGDCQCFKGWSGDSCSVFQSGKPCSSKPEDTKSTCSGNGVCFNGQCVCHPAFKGKDCELQKQCPRGGKDGPDGMRNKQCSNRGECFMGDCICKPGFTGANCGEELPCDCSGHGVCHSGACVCNPGFKGTNCATEEYCPGKIPTSPQGCSAHGVCNDGACFCFDGYAGTDCAFNLEIGKEAERQKSCVDPNVKRHNGPASEALSCSGHGVCGYGMLTKPRADGGKSFGTCLCMPGFGGDYCEEEKKCPKACNGHGQCFGGVCTCRYGYSGIDCSKLDLGATLCPNNCGSHGTCMLDECFCEPGFIGAACNVTVPCPGGADGKVCGGHGVCNYGMCKCAPGFEGEGCTEISKCPNDCSQHGVCYLGSCLCEPGYAGKSCEFSPGCGDKICENGGLCRQGGCLCPNGYTGDVCERMVPSVATTTTQPKCPLDDSGIECGGHGKCSERQTCTCEKGWSGKICNQPSMDDIAAVEDMNDEVGAVELMKEMSEEDAKPTLLEVRERDDNDKDKVVTERTSPCDVSNTCNKEVCAAVGGKCFDGVGCVCASPNANELCAQDLSLSLFSSSSHVEAISLSAHLQHTSTTSVDSAKHSSWNIVAIIGMSVTGCLAVVGLVAIAMVVIHHKRIRNSNTSNGVELDSHQRSLLNDQQSIERNRANRSPPVEDASVVTGFVQRR